MRTNKVKAITHNKWFPVVKVSRTKMVTILNSTKGRFFTTTHIDAKGKPRTMNAIKSNAPATPLGHLTVYSLQDRGYRTINPTTLTDLTFQNVHYKVK
jgi:hypothetical protein